MGISNHHYCNIRRMAGVTATAVVLVLAVGAGQASAGGTSTPAPSWIRTGAALIRA